jgi:hypothetical protein
MRRPDAVSTQRGADIFMRRPDAVSTQRGQIYS